MVFSDIQYTIIGYSGKPTDTDVHIYTYNKDNIEGILSNVPEWSASETTDDINTNGFSSQFVQSFKKILGENIYYFIRFRLFKLYIRLYKATCI